MELLNSIKSCLKSYIDLNIELRKKAKIIEKWNCLKNVFSKLKNSALVVKAMENARSSIVKSGYQKAP